MTTTVSPRYHQSPYIVTTFFSYDENFEDLLSASFRYARHIVNFIHHVILLTAVTILYTTPPWLIYL